MQRNTNNPSQPETEKMSTLTAKFNVARSTVLALEGRGVFGVHLDGWQVLAHEASTHSDGSSKRLTAALFERITSQLAACLEADGITQAQWDSAKAEVAQPIALPAWATA